MGDHDSGAMNVCPMLVVNNLWQQSPKSPHTRKSKHKALSMNVPQTHPSNQEMAPEDVSPFLPSSRDELPSLRRIKIPTGALAEFKQQMTLQVVDLPIPAIRCPQRVSAYKPSSQCPPSFCYAFNGFCSARRTVSTSCVIEAESMLSAEAMELIANSKEETGLYGSVSPRGLCISLVIPRESANSSNAIPFIDGIAALSDAKLKDGVPITTKIRYSIYGGPSSLPVSRVIAREAFDKNTLDGVTLMVRWSEKDAGKYRTECMTLGSTRPLPGEAARSLQMAIMKLSKSFGFETPPDFFLDPPSSDEGYYERQIRECSSEFRGVLHKEEAFVPSETMRTTKSGLLKRVQGCYARLTPIKLGLQGVVSSDAIHAILLCADGMEDKALHYAKTYREGLRPPEGEDEELDLHTAAVHTERVYLNGMVSLYANGGKSGEALQTDGNWVYKTTAAVVPIRTLMANFYVFSCGMESMIPENPALLKYMDIHVNKSIHMYSRVFAKDDLDRMLGCNPVNTVQQMSQAELHRMPDEERFVLSALGVDLRSNRMFIGDALAFLTQHGAPKSLLDLLTSASLRVGLRMSLSDGFSSCVNAMNTDVKDKDCHSNEVERLKRVADAALVMGCRKRACHSIPDTKPEKVRQLMKTFALKSGTYVTRLDNFVNTPRPIDHAHSLALTVYESYGRKSGGDMPHIYELETVMHTYSDMLAAIAKCFQLCMVKPGRPKMAFVIIHGYDMSHVSVNEVSEDGRLAPCGVGKVFEADKPCIVIVKLRSDTSCIVTPLVTQ
tara:strand:+ start:5652 stop:7991 length:2340 start_codon:yes stop_codon:yes gene_type:complete